mmetsp:Transcript_34480/g.73458  ORF Transcript_34480/g.73458 Transcript_34480/m.73458 type:complete len:256 (-) Transcript_34480:357-1124(-)|eukprot:CAMPEP_0206480504 /NCGR_PEP_ID=MMETSP0324_2-20121206/37382_1 /ASSEMBLY_ACC=CAM_ASM_000836 /TAXON_ID=2866 /ORGANISM="Crypthecodinium cohnii, Strain Seligo" /LENGTH=255 /DNA_ID=CAMNT_0053957401 /DNA_START=155 /DNA_END=922 /DNA_ORIENTATION=-
MYTAIVLGGSGAVGKELISHLSQREGWGAIHVLGRRKIDVFEGMPKVKQHVADLSNLEKATADVLGEVGPVSAAFNTMGVGAASKATKEELSRVDLELPTAFATAARAAEVKHFSTLTSAGADKDAKPGGFFGYFETIAGGGLYLSLKGKLEANIAALKFESSAAFRPAGLIGTPHTPAFIAWLNPKVDGFLPDQFKSSNINTLAAAMVCQAEKDLAEKPETPKEMEIFEGKALQDLYKKIPFTHGSLGARHSTE